MNAVYIFVVAVMFASFIRSFFFKESWANRSNRVAGWLIATIYVFVVLLLAKR